MNNSQLKSEITEDFFYGRGIDKAKNLIGKFLLNEETGSGGVIVETEAYLGEKDPSCHYARSKNGKRGKVFEKGAGTVYIYSIHTHLCMNFISEYKGNPEGILIRAIKPSRGIEKMKENRGWDDKKKLASGPGKLTEALGIEKEKYNGQKISESSLSLYTTDLRPEIEESSRVGISEAKDWPARFSMKNSSYVSKPVKNVDSDFDTNCYYQNLD